MKSLIAALLCAVAIMTDGTTLGNDGIRECVPLDRDWQGITNYAVTIDPFPENPNWKSFQLPYFKGGESLLLRRELTIPERWKGRRLLLRGEFCNYRTTVFVDGRNAASHEGGFGAFELDLTALLQPGRAHDLRIAIAGPQLSKEGKFPDALSYGQSWVWGASHFELLALPPTAIRSFILQPDGEKEVLTVTGRAEGGDAGEIRILDADGKVLKTRCFALNADGNFTAKVDCAGLHRWSPDAPVLYSVELRLFSGKTVCDAVTETMGLRSFTIRGNQFYLNGKRLNLQGDGWHARHDWSDEQIVELFTALKQAGVNIYRGHGPHPRNWYRIADRMGMLMVGEGPIHQFYRDDYRHPDYRKNAARTYREWVELIRNHPSLVIYSVDNEIINGEGGYQDDKRIAADREKKEILLEMAGVIRSADPTRPLMFEGDGAMGGAADIVNMHYPHELPFWPVIPRDTMWVRNAPGACEWKYTAPDGKKPLYIGEFGKNFDFSPRSLAIVAGDSAYFSTDAYYAAAGELMKQAIIGLRRSGVAGISPWNTSVYGMIRRNGKLAGVNGLYRGIREAFQPETVFPAALPRRAYRNQPVPAEFVVFNNSGHDRKYRLAVNGDTAPIELAAGESKTVRRILPPGTQQVNLELTDNGKTVARKEFRIEQSDPVPVPAETLYVIDGPSRQGQTLTALKEAGWRVNAVPRLSEVPDRAVCLIGEGALTQSEAELTAAAKRGIRVIVLAQTKFPGPCFGLRLEPMETSFLFPRDLKGFAPDAFFSWSADGLAATHLIRKPDDARFGIGLDSSGNQFGLKFAALLQREFNGGGIVTFCQLPVAAQLKNDPSAARLLAKLATEHPAPAPSTARLLKDPRLERLASDSRIAAPPVSGIDETVCRVIADGKAFAAEKPEKWKAFFARGGRLLLLDPTPEALQRLAELSGCSLSLKPQTAFQAELLDRSAFPGVSNEEFVWVVYDEWGSEYRGSDRKWPIVTQVLSVPQNAPVKELLRSKPLPPRRGEYGDSIRAVLEQQDFSYSDNNSPVGVTLPVGPGKAEILTLQLAEQYGKEPDLARTGKLNRWEDVAFSLDSQIRRILASAVRGL